MAEDSFTILLAITSNLWIWTMPIFVWFGTMGNFLCIFASLRTEMKNMISRYYFFAWAITNEASIIIWTLIWILNLAGSQWYDGPSCHFVSYVPPTFCRFLSTYFAVALIAERFISVRHPQHRQATSLLGNPKKTIATLTIWGFLHSTLYLLIIDYNCDIKKGYESWMTALTSINLIIIGLVPAVLIIVMSIQIFMKTRIPITAGRILSNPTTNGTTNVPASHQISNIKVAKQMKLTKILAILAVVSVCLSLPSYIAGFLFSVQRDWNKTLLIVYNILGFFSRASYGINFFICWALDHDYRQAAYDIFHCRPRIDPTSLLRNIHGNSRCDAPLLTTSSGNATALQDTTTVLEMSSNPNAQVSINTNDEISKF